MENGTAQRKDALTQQPSLQVLSADQITMIHEASLDILSSTGIVMMNDEARKLLLDGGASDSGGRIRIPPHMVADAIASAPKRIAIHNRRGELVMPLEEGRVYFGTGSDCIFTIDVDTQARRKATASDVQQIARFCDGMKEIDFVMSMANPSDVAWKDLYIHEFIGMIRGSIKPNIFTANDVDDMADIYRIACAVVGGEAELRAKPFILHYAEPISPLLFPEGPVGKLLFCADKEIPACFIPSTNTGAGGPITMAGALALGNAESLAGLVICQLRRRGSPFVYGMNTATLDLKSTIVSYGSPELAISTAACAELARRHGLPSWGYAAGTDSKSVDAQAGAEAAMSIFWALLSGSNLAHDVGYIEYGSTSSMEMIAIANEIISAARFLAQGIRVDEITLARDAIARSVPGAGFLADEHTLDHWRWATWHPQLTDRSRYDTWLESGSNSMATRANRLVHNVLQDHPVAALSSEVEREIADVLKSRSVRCE